MAEASLINISDVREYRQLDSKFNQVRFDAYVKDVQRKNLRGLLGEKLYLAFMNDERTTGIYKELLDGKEYLYQGDTYRYYGLKPLLSYWFLAVSCREGDVFHSTHGAISLVNNPQQNFESAKQKNELAAQFMETAQVYANDCITFLNRNSSNYPLWESGETKKGINFITFKI